MTEILPIRRKTQDNQSTDFCSGLEIHFINDIFLLLNSGPTLHETNLLISREKVY